LIDPIENLFAGSEWTISKGVKHPQQVV